MTIHETAIIGQNVTIADDVNIGPFTIIHSNVEIAGNTNIGSYCELGVPNNLGKVDTTIIDTDSTIRSHSIIYAGCGFGPGLTTGHRVTIRENTYAGINFQVGTLSDIQGDCSMGDNVRFHSNVHICKTSKIGNCVWVFPFTVLTNDPHPPSEILTGPIIEDFSIVATGSILLPGSIVRKNSMVGAATVVKGEVPIGTICVGNPGKIVGKTSKILHKGDGKPAYPWYRHFRRGYPAGALPEIFDENF